MAAKKFDISVIFSAIDKVSHPVKAMSRSLSGLGDKTDKIGRGMQSLGRKMTLGLTVPLTAIAVAATKAHMTFDDSMQRVLAVTKATSSEFKMLEDRARELGRTTAFTAKEVAEGMSFLAMAGLSAGETLNAIGPSLTLARAGSIDLAKAADIATNIMASMELKTKDLVRITDVLAFSATNSKGTIQGMGEAFRPVAGFASAAGVSLEQLGALLAKLAQAGQRGSIAGTLLRNAFQKMLDPNKKLIDLTHKYQIALDEFKTPDGKIKNFAGLIDELNKKKVSPEEIIGGFGMRGGRAILDLMKKNKINLHDFEKSLIKSEGTAKRLAETMRKGYGVQFKIMISAIVDAGIALSKALEPAVRKLMKAVIKLAQWFSGLTLIQRKWIGVIGAVVAALGPLLMALGTLIIAFKAISFIFGPAILLVFGKIILIAAAVGAAIWLIVKIIKNWNKIQTFFINTLKSVWGWFVKWKGIIKLLTMVLFPLSIIPIKIAENWAKIKEAVGASLNWISDQIKKVTDTPWFRTFMRVMGIVGEAGKILAGKAGEVASSVSEKVGSGVSGFFSKGLNMAKNKALEINEAFGGESQIEIILKASPGTEATTGKQKSSGNSNIKVRTESMLGPTMVQ